MSSIKEMVSPGRVVRFVKYRKGALWYITETGFEFPVPVEDTGDADFLAEDKAMLFMRYIRKHLDSMAEGRAAQA